MFELYSDDIKSEYSSNSKDIFKYSTKIYIYIYIYIYVHIYIKKTLHQWDNFRTCYY